MALPGEAVKTGWITSLFVSLALGCGCAVYPPLEACEAGRQVACTCADGSPGFSRCDADGRGWGACQCACNSDCSGRECGPDPVCGRSCGVCPAETSCIQGRCEGCQTDCTGRECGPDPVCGESCGSCAQDEVCTQQGRCELESFPAGEQGDLCSLPLLGCQPGLDCLVFEEGHHGFCAAQCDCYAGTGCPPAGDPAATCTWADVVQGVCWCGYLCPGRDASRECPGGGEGFECTNLGAANPFWACLPL